MIAIWYTQDPVRRRPSGLMVPWKWSNTLRIATEDHDEQSREVAANEIDKSLTDAGVDVRTAESVGRAEAVTGGHLEPVIVILLVTALPMGVIGCIGLASTMSANVLERIRELGVMHAIGARPKAVRRIVIAEGPRLPLTGAQDEAPAQVALRARHAVGGRGGDGRHRVQRRG